MSRFVTKVHHLLVFIQLAVTPLQAVEIQVTGRPEIMFSALRDGCEPSDIPDAPARAFRDASGLIHLFASHQVARALVGTSFDNLRKDCTPAFRGLEKDDPSVFNDRGWLSSFYTEDGRTVFALVHNEFHGDKRPWLCPSHIHNRCWYNSINLTASSDGGRSFTGSHVIIAAHHSYMPDEAGRVGASSPSNIITKENKIYFLYVNDTRNRRGRICLIRTNKIENPSSWRAWDGQAFNVEYANPYSKSNSLNTERSCEPLRGLLSGSIGSLTFHEKSGLYILTQDVVASGQNVSGVYYSSSRDLINWSKPKLLIALPTDPRHCVTPYVYAYSSMIDPQASTRNFETVGDDAFLLLTRRSCASSWDRDLVKMKLQISN
jgi:hypothetical protein